MESLLQNGWRRHAPLMNAVDCCWQGLHKLPLFISSTAWLAARAVSAINVSDGFWLPVDVIQAPSVTKTFLQVWNWFHSFSNEVFGSFPIRTPPISWMSSPGS